MKQKTAVEWYSDKLMEILGDKCNEFTKEQTLSNHYALKQAKELEKRQIVEARQSVPLQMKRLGWNTNAIDGEQYYTQNYGNDND